MDMFPRLFLAINLGTIFNITSCISIFCNFFNFPAKGRRIHETQETGASVPRALGRLLTRQIVMVMRQHFPDLLPWLGGLKDTRKPNVDYSVGEVSMAGIALFILKEGSRNAMNLDRSDDAFRQNYEKVFGAGLPHMDVVEDLFRKLGTDGLENVKNLMVNSLLRKKVFRDHLAPGGGLIVAIDGTGVATYQSDPGGGRTSKTYKSGKTRHFDYVLEAKIVTANGLSISVGTAWIENVGEDYDKQDCEQKAFVRLAAKMKALFPRMRMCIAADGLYPNATFFGICQKNQWDYIVTLKDGNLAAVWEELGLRPKDTRDTREVQAKVKLKQTYRWVNAIEYGKFSLNWVECIEELTNKDGTVSIGRFVHVTNLPLDRDAAAKVSKAGRLRWRIENEGFNDQKNGGYNLGHKFSRVSFNAMKNYYQCLQIAHIINQLAMHTTAIAGELKQWPNLTHAHIWTKFLQYLATTTDSQAEIHQGNERRRQVRMA